MYFHFDVYPADLLAVLSGRPPEEQGRIVSELLVSLVANAPDTIADRKAREYAEILLAKAREKSRIYSRNRQRRTENEQIEKERAEQAQQEKELRKERRKRQEAEKIVLYGFGLVRVTEAELHKLLDDYGEEDLRRMAEKLQSYKESTGRTYKSDAAALRSWVADWLRKAKGTNTSYKEKERARDAATASSMLTPEQRRAYGL